MAERAMNPDYVDDRLSLAEKVDAAFRHWHKWRFDYDTERALRTDLMAIFLRSYGTTAPAHAAMHKAINDRRTP